MEKDYQTLIDLTSYTVKMYRPLLNNIHAIRLFIISLNIRNKYNTSVKFDVLS